MVSELVSLSVLPQGGGEVTTRSSRCHAGEKNERVFGSRDEGWQSKEGLCLLHGV